MKIYLRCRLPSERPYDRVVSALLQVIEVGGGTDISDILPRIYAGGLAEWRGNLLEGEVVEKYRTSGNLESDKVYNILSNNPPKTLEFLRTLPPQFHQNTRNP